MKLLFSILLLSSLAVVGCQDAGTSSRNEQKVVPKTNDAVESKLECSLIVSRLAAKGTASVQEILLELADLKSKNPTWDLSDISNCLDKSYKISCSANDCVF